MGGLLDSIAGFAGQATGALPPGGGGQQQATPAAGHPALSPHQFPGMLNQMSKGAQAGAGEVGGEAAAGGAEAAGGEAGLAELAPLLLA